MTTEERGGWLHRYRRTWSSARRFPDGSVVVFRNVMVPVPPSGVARLPGPYRHDFASIPDYWREVTTTSKYVSFPMLEIR